MASASSSTAEYYVLHTDSTVTKAHGLLMAIDDNHWTKILEVKERRSHQKSSKYKDICKSLPDKYTKIHGYHIQCYKHFTAMAKSVPSVSHITDNTVPLENQLRSSTLGVGSQKSSSGLFPKECLFCNTYRKRHSASKVTYELPILCETFEIANSIKEAINKLNDHHLFVKVGSIDMIAKEIKYHNTCKNKYIKRASRISIEISKSDYGQLRQDHHIAFKSLVLYINSTIIHDLQEELLTSLHQRYMAILLESSGIETTYPAHSLQTKIQDYFKDKIVFTMKSKKEGIVLR